MKKVRWSEEEDKQVIEYVKTHRTTKGLVLAGRTPKAIAIRRTKLSKEGILPSFESVFSNSENVSMAKKVISEHPYNLNKAFSIIGSKTGLSARTIRAYWYSESLRNPIYRKKIGPCFMTVGKKGSINSKILHNSNPSTLNTSSIWASIKKLFRLK